MVLVLLLSALVFSGNDIKGTNVKQEQSSNETMLTKEVLAGSATFLKNTTVEDLEKEETVKAVSTTEDVTEIALATLEESIVPVVGADEITEEAVIVAAEEAVPVTPEAVEPEIVQQDSEWTNKVVAKVEETANIRGNADAESDLVGHLPKGAAADIVERGEAWTQISSGNVVGYVKNDYLAFDDEAKQMAESFGKKATVTTETLRVRKENNTESEVVALASVGDSLQVVSEETSWVAVTTDGTTGYVASEFVEISYNLGVATSIEEERAAEEAKKAEEARKAEKAEKEAKANAAKKETENSKQVSVETTKREATEVSVDEATLLGALVQVEAGGQNYECQLAVASVIINRVNSSRFPNTISGVIYQKGQFPGAHNGKLAKILARGPRSSSYSAAQAALNGENLVGGRLHFNMQGAINYNNVSNYVIIGGNCFY